MATKTKNPASAARARRLEAAGYVIVSGPVHLKPSPAFLAGTDGARQWEVHAAGEIKEADEVVFLGGSVKTTVVRAAVGCGAAPKKPTMYVTTTGAVAIKLNG